MSQQPDPIIKTELITQTEALEAAVVSACSVFHIFIAFHLQTSATIIPEAKQTTCKVLSVGVKTKGYGIGTGTVTLKGYVDFSIKIPHLRNRRQCLPITDQKKQIP